MLGAITMLRKICNHPDLVCPPDQSALDAFIHKGSFTEADLVQDDSEDDGSFGEEPESVTERSGKLEVLAKILPLWKKQGHRCVLVLGHETFSDVRTWLSCLLSSESKEFSYFVNG